MSRPIIIITLVFAGGLSRANGQEVNPKPGARTFANATGWQWHIRPDQSSAHSARGLVMIRDEDKEGALLVAVAWNPDAVSAVEVRPVAFDAAGERYVLKVRAGGGEKGVNLRTFSLDPRTLPGTKVTFVGMETLTPEGKKLASQEAARRAREAGVEVLPLPVLGEAYEFVLTDSEGKRIDSRALQGKVVLIDCWATWCTPCMAKMPKLKEVYAKRRKDGLEVVGVNFDQDAEKAKRAIASLELKWPTVIIPGDQQTRELWNDVAGISTLPRLLVIGRDGKLRADCSPARVEEEVEGALQQRPITDKAQ